MLLEVCFLNYKMLLHYSFLHFLCLLLPLAFSATHTITKPGCPTQCGNLEIPFPFGLGSNCSIGPWFDIHCNTSTNPPKPYISTTDLEVTEISRAHIRVKLPKMALTCYNINMTVVPAPNALQLQILEMSRLTIDLSSTPYTVSEANELTAFGCDDLATVAVQEGTEKDGYGGGCVAYCSHINGSSGNGYCPGNGCCQASIPKGTNFLDVSLSDLHRNWRTRKLLPCNFAFVGEKGNGSTFTYNKSSLSNSTNFLNNNPRMTSNPLVLDWRIGSQNCNVMAKNSSTYACQENTVCMDSESGAGGYLCDCMEGYEGNPYLGPGCHDIDECESNPCDQRAICTNTRGSFNCSCEDGYYGDGKIHGVGCLIVPMSKSMFPVIKLSIVLVSGMGLLLLLSVWFWLRKILHKRKKKKLRHQFFKRNGGLLLQQQISSRNEGGMLGKTKLFPAKELEKATDHFNESRILGQGGQGTVYKGMLSDGEIVAIKKSKLVDQDHVEQFINEVVILSQINHRNVVKLLGCCLETEVPLLVYEFVPNGTLFDHIHDENTEFPILWNMRLKIAADVAGALAYLHSATSLPIFHRDIKSSNILLDEKYVAKVSDFGTSRSVSVDQTHLTTLVRGTFGYLDPEYFQSSQFTEKSDVYSFGVVLVELLTGQRPISCNRTGEERSLAIRFLVSMEGNSLDKILDDQVLKHGTKKEVVAVARLAERCLNLNGKKRPTMKEVAMELESVKMSQQITSTAEARLQRARFHDDEAEAMIML